KVQAQQLLPRPQNMSWAEACSYGLSYFTAYRMLMDQCKLQPGHNVLIWGAAGGLGGFATRVKEILGASPDIVFEHVGRATFPTSVYVVKPFGKVVICGATSGFQLDFDVRYLWMRQKQIIGSHFANAYECMRANQLMAEGKVRPVLWQTMEFDGVPTA